MGYLSAFIFTGICAAVTWYGIRTIRHQQLSRANGCQPPRRYPHKDPLFGFDLFLKTGKLFQNNQYLPELVRRYREYGSTFQTRSSSSFTINSIRPENLQTVWVSKFKDWGVQPVRLPAQDPFCGVGFITTDGPVWEHSRALLKPSFHRANMTDLSTFEKYLRMVINKIPKDGATIDLQPLLSSLYLDTATLWLFGESFDSLSGETSTATQSFLEAFDYAMFGSGLRIALGPLKVLHRDSKWYESCTTTHRFADYYVDKALKWRHERMHSEAIQSSSEIPRDDRQQHVLLYAMAEQTDDRIELRNQILQAVMAAKETTAVLISNVFFLLSRHSGVWQRLRQEVLSLADSELTVETLPNLRYLRNVVNETLRLYPVFPQMNRVSLTDTTLPVGGGDDGESPIFAPKGTMFDTSYYVLHRQQSIWGPTAEDFDPDRWETFKPGAWTFLPFGAGPRGCAGRLKALTEASYVIVRLVQEFGKIESRDERPWTGQVQLTAKNVNGCKVSLRA